MLTAATFALLLATQATEPVEASVGILNVLVGVDTSLAKPELLRFTDAQAWETYCKNHPGAKPKTRFESHMVLVIPAQVGGSDEVVQTPGEPGVRAWLSEKVLIVHVSIKTKLPVKPVKTPLPPRSVLSYVVVPISPLPVEVQVKLGDADAGTSTLPATTGTPAAGQISLKGRLTWNRIGAWTFHEEKKSYDLHLVPPGFKAGDQVQIVGRVAVGYACIHMIGTMFHVESMRLSK